MKKQYTTPNLTTHGDVAEITQILGSKTRTDFLFLNGSVDSDASSAPDQGSRDICIGSPDPVQPPANCDPRF